MSEIADAGSGPRPRWTLVSAILGDAIEAPPEARDQLVADRCGSDTALRHEVLSLLEAHEAARGFANGPPPWLGAWADAALRSGLPDRLGPYRLLGVIGRGGMGTVYRARRDDREYEREVAVKIVSHEMNRESVLRRF